MAIIESAATVNASEQNMLSLTDVLHKTSPVIAKSRAVCVNPPLAWEAFDIVLSDDMRGSVKEQAFSHPPIASNKVHYKVRQRQRRSR